MKDGIALIVDVVTIFPQPLLFAWLLCSLQPMRRPTLVMISFTGIIVFLHVLSLWVLVISPAMKVAVMFLASIVLAFVVGRSTLLASLSLVLIYMALMMLAELLSMFLALLILQVGPGNTIEDCLILLSPHLLPMRILYTACFILLLLPLFIVWKHLINKGTVYYTPALLPTLLLQSAMTLLCEILLILSSPPTTKLLPATLVTVLFSYGALLAVLWVYHQEQRQYTLRLHNQELLLQQYTMSQERAAAATKAEEIVAIHMELEQRLRDAAEALASLAPHTAKVYLEQTAQWLRSEQSPQLCENLVVNAVVTQQQRRCQAAGINLDCSLDLPQELGLEAPELCSIFSNLLDNAVRACAILPEDERSIQLSAAPRGRYLIIKEKNPLPPVISYPGDKNDHGLGLGILREIALRHGGDFEMCQERGMFSVTLWLGMWHESTSSLCSSDAENVHFSRHISCPLAITPLWFLPLSQLTMVAFVSSLWDQYYDMLHHNLLGLMILLGISADILLLKVFWRLWDSQRLERQSQALEAEQKIERAYWEHLSCTLLQLRRIRHDMNNHLQAVNLLVDSGYFGRAADYLDELIRVLSREVSGEKRGE